MRCKIIFAAAVALTVGACHSSPAEQQRNAAQAQQDRDVEGYQYFEQVKARASSRDGTVLDKYPVGDCTLYRVYMYSAHDDVVFTTICPSGHATTSVDDELGTKPHTHWTNQVDTATR